MIKLMKNEFKKIFAKKSTYIIFVILILMLLGISFLNKIASKSMMNSYDRNYYESIDKLKSDLKEIEKAKFIGIDNTEERWKSIKRDIEIIEIYELLEDSEEKEWKQSIIYSNEFKTQNDRINMELKAVRENDKKILESEEYKKLVKEYEKETEMFLKLTQEEFTQNVIKKHKELNKKLEKQIKDLKTQENEKINNSTQIQELEKQIEENNIVIEVNEIRLAKKIKYGDKHFMNRYLVSYEMQKQDLIRMQEPKEDAKIQDKSMYYSSLKAYEEAKYIIENEKDIKNPLSGNHNVKNFLSQHLPLYMVVVVVIAGMIVSEEYSKGTIKNLLVKPYRRCTILFSKLLVVIIVSILAFVLMFAVYTVISGILYDFNSMKELVVQYNANTKTMEEMNLFVYVLRDFAYTLPFILVITLFTFAVSTITTSSAASIILGMLSLLATGIVNQILGLLHYNWVRYIPTINWDWTIFIRPEYNTIYGPNFILAIIITIATYLIFLIPSFIVFKKRDIKNI